jgi:Protein of unknown function (DUF1592)/Protein of unknown function (DUF1588)/Protein of unknown function (DUF1585)/Protein of unknown function (DUF1587)/Protein of unknown function (DUF1595)/Planctomycete cytochrome C
MSRLVVVMVGAVAAVLCLAVAADPIQAANSRQVSAGALAVSPSSQRALIDKYCVTCHNQRLHRGELTLETIDVQNIGAGAEVWEKVLRKVRAGEMPPAASPRPDPVAIESFVGWLEGNLDLAAEATPQPGRVAVHRLNRSEYANAIRDLLDLEIDDQSVLIDEDPGVTGFDNTAGALSVSPVLVERYLAAARRVSRMAVGDLKVAPVFDTYTLPKMLKQDDRMSEDLPFASKGGVAIRHRFLVDGEYVLKARLHSQLYNYLLGLGRPHQLEMRLDGVRIRQFTVGGAAPGRPAPDSYAGDIPGSPDWEQYMHDADAGLEVRFAAKAGTRVVAVSFVNSSTEPEGVLQPAQVGGSGFEYNQLYEGNPKIMTVAIGGPYNATGPGDTPSRRRIFVCRPKASGDSEDELGCATRILTTLARRAYRRPVTEKDVRPLLTFYASGRKQENFDAGIQSALTRILIDPEFLIRIEPDPSTASVGAVYRLNDVALASRLSFFLWASIPDEELLDLAERGKLQDPKLLAEQIRRMTTDGRFFKTFVDNFASQWLGLRKLRGVTPDPDLFPEFDENLREAFRRETELFLDSQIREDRSVVDLLSSNYTFVNEHLARFYGIPNVYGDAYRRVTIGHVRPGGLLAQGSILTVTSYADRTSPVFRGKWVLENLLAAPPPEPPPNVSDLRESPPGKPVSVRQRLEEHRRNPACAGCHARMDPFGFTLENFDGIGKWRTTNEDQTPIDASGTLPDGTVLNGIASLEKYLLERRHQFAMAVTEKLLTYALGRGLEYYDLPAVRKIVRHAAANDYRWSSIIDGIVKSVPFQMSVVRSDRSVSAQRQ